MSYFPVCCAASISPEAMDRFIAANQQNHPDVGNFFVFVDDVSAQYTEATKASGRDQPSAAPFRDQSPRECYTALRQMFQNGSDLDPAHFIIMDDRTVEDGTVLLVEGEGEGDATEIQTVRTAPEITKQRILLLKAGMEFIDWYQEIAQEADDNVLRAAAIEERPPP